MGDDDDKERIAASVRKYEWESSLSLHSLDSTSQTHFCARTHLKSKTMVLSFDVLLLCKVGMQNPFLHKSFSFLSTMMKA
ncbi:unnamed protein product [Arabidopsis lyrata]|nr:unnamed protein product [Arabidopsis lyrata]